MSVSITIRNVPQETRDELASRAARRGQSLQEFLRLEIEGWANRPDPEVLLASIKDRVERTGSTFPSAEILAALDADRH